MKQDLHSHTYYSFCGEDSPRAIVEAAIAGGIELFGISDHNYGIGGQWPGIVFHDEAVRIEDYRRALIKYREHMDLVAQTYKDEITVKVGMEIATVNQPNLILPRQLDASIFDYCLIEHIDDANTIVSDLFEYARRCRCPKTGVAHTDLFAYIKRIGQEPLDFFSRMADEGIFWEINVNLDSIHGYREHAYVKSLFSDEALLDILRKSGVQLSVGFDGHRVGEYRSDLVKTACERIAELGLELVSWA